MPRRHRAWTNWGQPHAVAPNFPTPEKQRLKPSFASHRQPGHQGLRLLFEHLDLSGHPCRHLAGRRGFFTRIQQAVLSTVQFPSQFLNTGLGCLDSNTLSTQSLFQLFDLALRSHRGLFSNGQTALHGLQLCRQLICQSCRLIAIGFELLAGFI